MFAQSNITNPAGGYTTLPTFGDTTFFRGQNVSVAWTHTFGPNLLNEARIGFQRNNPVENCEECPRAPGFIESFGIQNLHALSPALEGYPYFSFVNYGAVGDAGYRPVTNVEMVEKYQDSVTWTRGRHAIVIGADFSRGRIFDSRIRTHLTANSPSMASTQDWRVRFRTRLWCRIWPIWS